MPFWRLCRFSPSHSCPGNVDATGQFLFNDLVFHDSKLYQKSKRDCSFSFSVNQSLKEHLLAQWSHYMEICFFVTSWYVKPELAAYRNFSQVFLFDHCFPRASLLIRWMFQFKQFFGLSPLPSISQFPKDLQEFGAICNLTQSFVLASCFSWMWWLWSTSVFYTWNYQK